MSHAPEGYYCWEEEACRGCGVETCRVQHTASNVHYTVYLRGRRLKEQPCVIGGVVIDVYVVIVQGETVRSRVTIGVADNEVDYLFRHLTFGVSVAR